MTAPSSSNQQQWPPWLLALLGIVVVAAVAGGVAQNGTTTTTTTTAKAATTTRPVATTTVRPPTTIAATTTTVATTTRPPGTVPPGAVTVRPSGGDDTAAVIAAIAANPTVIIDQPLRTDGTVTITASNRTITFTGTGAFTRPTLNTLQMIRVTGASNVTFNNPHVAGPGGVCDVPRPPPTTPGQSPTYQAVFDATHYAQHAIWIEGTTNLAINGGYFHDVRGDGVYLVGQAKGTRINNLHTRCTGRSSISNVDSTDTIVTGGFYERSGLWAFNVEPDSQTKRFVTGYLIDRPKVGVSNWELLWVGGNCTVTGVVLNKPDVSLRAGRNSIRGCKTPTGAPAYTYTPA